MFIQVIQGHVKDADRLKERVLEWERTLGADADGWLGSTSGVTGDGTSVAVVRFESRAHADASSARPEQDAWWAETATCYDGDVTFRDYDDAFTMLDGGSNDAGFVQVMHGRTSDAGRLRSFMQGSMDGLREMRPEIIGGTVAIADDGDFTQTVYFTTEAAARGGEQQEMPADVAEQMGDMTVDEYLDLSAPWFTGSA
jgi:hypothetical protein